MTDLIKCFKMILFNTHITKKTVRRQPYSLRKIEAWYRMATTLYKIIIAYYVKRFNCYEKGWSG